MEEIVGIDLGTTFSSVAYVDDRGAPKVIPNASGELMTPSVVLIQNGQIVVGDAAMNQWVTNEEHVVRWVKRAMGNPDYRFQGMTAVEISAEILKALKADAEADFGHEIKHAVITCPAYFAALEIENTMKAGELAGFMVKEIIKEPTAAAVYYGIDNMHDGEKVLICDLGGGTYDATLLAYDAEPGALRKGVFTPLASGGSRILGGFDWTMDLVGMVTERYMDQFGVDPMTDLVAGQMLQEACEKAKRDFARMERVTIPCAYQGKVKYFEVTRDEFEAQTEPHIMELVGRTEETLQKIQKTWKDVDQILLVGGSSRLRRMGLALEQASGIKPSRCKEPDLSVALGAAILAKGKVRRRGALAEVSGGLMEVEYKRIIPRSLGTRAIVRDRDGSAHVGNSLIIPHGTEIPITAARDDYEISTKNQVSFDVPVVEFENDQDFDPVDNFRFKCLSGAQRGDRIQVTFHYDESGIPTVEALDKRSAAQLQGERLPYVEPDAGVIISLRPRWVVFALDNSGSMDGSKLQNAVNALIDNAGMLLGPGGDRCRVGVVSFSNSAEVVCLPTNDLNKLERAVRSLRATGLTAMDEGIELAIQLVMAAPEGVDKDVVMLTDGMPDSHRRDRTLRMARGARDTGITLSSLGIGLDDIDLDFLQSLTPLALVIEAGDDMNAAMGTLLTQSQASRTGGITDARFGSLEDTSS
jgi:molecular chaperone DnaK